MNRQKLLSMIARVLMRNGLRRLGGSRADPRARQAMRALRFTRRIGRM